MDDVAVLALTLAFDIVFKLFDPCFASFPVATSLVYHISVIG